MARSTYMGIPREEIPWFPTIDNDLCTLCGECKEFCPNEVFEEGESVMLVADKYNCVIGCDKCLVACDFNALSFPSKEELMENLKHLRAKYK